MSAIKKKDPVETAKTSKGNNRGNRDVHVGQALRTAYQETVSEAIPVEMLDLLGKLS